MTKHVFPFTSRVPALTRRRLLQASGGLAAGAAVFTPREAWAQATPASTPVTVRDNGLPPENQPEARAVLEDMIARYQEMNPNVTIESLDQPWDPQTFPARLAAGELPDAFNIPYTEPRGIIARGQAADITDYLSAWEYFGSFNETALSVVTGPDGRIYGIPVYGYLLGLMYNRTFFEEAGLDPNAPPETWDALREAAKSLTADGRAGFAETSTANQGGWHFTAWMYSAGGELEEVEGDTVTATFASDTGVSVLDFLKAMRFEDGSMTEQQLLDQDKTREMLATGQIAMAIQAPDSLPWLAERFPDVDLAQFGFGILPQNGGDATLAGGSVWMFNPKSDPAVIQAAVDWILYKEFDLANYEARLQADQERGAFIGTPESPIFSGDYQAARQAVVDKYANAPVENYAPFITGSDRITLSPEPPVETQQLYAAIDPAVQAVLTDEGADPKALLEQAQQQFQTQVLDQL